MSELVFGGSWPEVIGKVIIVATVQASLGSLELSSHLSIATLAATQDNVDIVIGEIRSYLIIGTLWTIGTTLLMYTMHATRAAIINLVANIIIMTWIIYNRYSTLKMTARKNGLKVPSIL